MIVIQPFFNQLAFGQEPGAPPAPLPPSTPLLEGVTTYPKWRFLGAIGTLWLWLPFFR